MSATSFSPAQEDLLRCIRGEFLEMPGLRLTSAQAQRLWGLDIDTCLKLLAALVDARFLLRGSDGRYMRLGDGAISQPRFQMARAGLDREFGRQRRGG